MHLKISVNNFDCFLCNLFVIYEHKMENSKAVFKITEGKESGNPLFSSPSGRLALKKKKLPFISKLILHIKMKQNQKVFDLYFMKIMHMNADTTYFLFLPTGHKILF